ncbi:MAG TPA: inositol monophosphatase family protein, partial [Bdellovibrionota bacterium]|nr:inositol monophosphatase family protein [Bdellovibrionota bacterium]
LLTKGSHHPILTEEDGLLLGKKPDSSAIWIVDPLDGTFNYDRNLPLCCVAVALWKTGPLDPSGVPTPIEPILGVIYDFNRDEAYIGLIGEGARINDEPFTASEVTEVAQAALATGFPVGRDFGQGSLMHFVEQIRGFKKQRLLGTAALAMAFAACGRVDAYREDGGRLWDVAAGLAIHLAAGGHVWWELTEKVGERKHWYVNVATAGTKAILDHLTA